MPRANEKFSNQHFRLLTLTKSRTPNAELGILRWRLFSAGFSLTVLYSKFELCWGAYLCVQPGAEELDSSLKNLEIVCPYFWKACWRRGIARAAREATRGGHGELKGSFSQCWHCVSRGFKAFCPRAAGSWNTLENRYLDQAIEETDLWEMDVVYSWGGYVFPCERRIQLM